MNDKTKAAMQMALEALEYTEVNTVPIFRGSIDEAITDLREALAQPQDMKECRHCGWLCKPNDAPSKKGYVLAQSQDDEPVAEVIDHQTAAMIHEDKPLPYGTKLYTAPQSVEAMRIETLEKAAWLREQIALQGVQSNDYEDGFWDGLAAYEKAIREMK